jgi:capsular polysaccharide transport system ATP-binding protein
VFAVFSRHQWTGRHRHADVPRIALRMIEFQNVSKNYHIRKFEKHVFTDLNFQIERGESIGICGANGAGKSTLMRLIAGVEMPSGGRVVREMSTSWPIGYASCFQSSLTGADNARFIARIYNMDEGELLDFVQDFAQLGPYFYQPVHTYSAGMNARLAFGISLAIDFECYLVDEVTGAGDERFRARCEEALLHRRDNASLVMISHDPGTLRQYCKRGAVVYGGTLVFFDTIDEASEVHHRLQMRAA